MEFCFIHMNRGLQEYFQRFKQNDSFFETTWELSLGEKAGVGDTKD